MIDYQALEDLGKRLLGTEIYVVDSKAAGLAWVGDKTLGLTCKVIDLLAKDHLESAGRWFGRRPAIALNSELIHRDTEAFDARFRPSIWTEANLSLRIFLHELAHIAEFGIDTDEHTESDIAGYGEWCSYREAARDSLFAAGAKPIRPCPQHGIQFARLCCHAAYRAEQLGSPSPLQGIYDGDQYGIPPIHQANQVLWFELEEFAKQEIPLLEIKTKPIPGFYEMLWEGHLEEDRNERIANDG